MAKFAFKSKMDASHVIAGLAASGNEAGKNAAIAAAHKRWPPKKHGAK